MVGGGITGLLCALEFQHRGYSVVVLDAGAKRPCASWAAGGILASLYPWRSSAAILALTEGAFQAYQAIVAFLERQGAGPVELWQPGALFQGLTDRNEALAWADNQRLEVQQTGVNSLFLPCMAVINNSQLLQALRRHLAAQRSLVFATVAHIRRSGGHWRLETEKGHWRGKQLLVAAGVWSGSVLDSIDAGLSSTLCQGLKPVKGQMLRYAPGAATLNHILLSDAGYLVPRQDGSILAGSTMEPDVSDQRPTRAAWESLQQLATGLLPALQGRQPVAQWAGIRPGSPEGIPWIGPAAGYDNLFVATGHHRNGVACAPATARKIARQLAGA